MRYGLAILLVVIALQPSLFGYLALRKPLTHFVRNGTHFCANLLWANAVIVMPLATVFAIGFALSLREGEHEPEHRIEGEELHALEPR